ncbi:hypothetical protein RJ640_018139, partial [Escallonia rubra]
SSRVAITHVLRINTDAFWNKTTDKRWDKSLDHKFWAHSRVAPIKKDAHSPAEAEAMAITEAIMWSINQNYGNAYIFPSSKKLNATSATKAVYLYWDLTRAKFGSRPEPQSGFYFAVVIDGKMTLLVGDSPQQAYAKTKALKPNKTQAMVLRREHVYSNRHYVTKANINGRTRDISIGCKTGTDPKLCFSVDGKRVLQVKHLKWKFRGNERIEVDGVYIQVSWDVYNWLFEDEDQDGYALFMFKFEKLGSEEDFEGLNSGMGLWGQDSCGFGFERKKMKKGLLRPAARSSSSSSLSSASSNCSSVMEWASVEENELKGPSGFSLLVYAWKK